MRTWIGLLMAAYAGAAEYHVAPSGDDGNPGTAAAPFRTLKRAAQAAQPGDLCLVHAGVYRETLRPARSGTAASPITFQAAPGEKAVLNGADTLAGWSVHQGRILKAPMAWDLGAGYNQVFCGGIMLEQARFPNPGPDPLHPNLMKLTLTGTTLQSDTLAQPAGTWAGATFHGWVGVRWTAQGCRIAASGPGQATIDAATLTKPWFEGAGVGYLTGTMAALDAPGEWHREAGTLYLWPPAGADAKAPKVEAKRRAWAIDLDGVSYVHVSGLDVFAASVRMTGTGCRVERMTARYLSQFTHPGEGYSNAAGADSGRNGIVIRGTGNAMLASSLAYSAGSGVILDGTGNRVADCVIRDMDYQGIYSCPVVMLGTKNILEWCTVERAGRDLVQMGGTTQTLVHNEFRDPGLLAWDLGALYRFGADAQGTVIAWNWVHDNHNRKGTSPGIYLDNNCKNFLVHHNVVWNCEGDAGIRVNGPAQGHRIYNNTTFGCDAPATHTYTNDPTGPYSIDTANNLTLLDPTRELRDTAQRDFRLREGSPYIDQGKIVPGITDGYKGSAPDLGAYESGGEAWTAGAREQPDGPIAIRPRAWNGPGSRGPERAPRGERFDGAGRKAKGPVPPRILFTRP